MAAADPQKVTNMILIITSKSDGHIEPVTRHLDSAGVQWVRFNTEDAAANLEICLDSADRAGYLRFHDSGRSVRLENIQAVWYRKPERVQVSHFQLENAALDYVEAEFREILDGIYALLIDVPWINNPFTTKLAHRKMAQLRVANRIGFRTPRTIVTNSAKEAFHFADAVAPMCLAIKSLGAVSVTEEADTHELQYGIFTRKIDRRELEAVSDKIAHLPTTFQEFVPKRYELRITCVGRRVLTCRIDARRGDLTADDYRFDTTNLEHRAFDCPELHARLHRYMAAFGLKFACFDIIVASSGEPVFLEANANGQWLWVEHLTTLPIGRAIAEELISYCRMLHRPSTTLEGGSRARPSRRRLEPARTPQRDEPFHPLK